MLQSNKDNDEDSNPYVKFKASRGGCKPGEK